MNVLYCGDRGVEDGVLISVLSLMKFVKEPLNVFLLTIDYRNDKKHFRPITPKFVSGLNKVLRKHHVKSTCQLFELSDTFAKFPPTANINSRFTPGCMLRLYADLISALPGHVLYLDNDVIAHGDPTAFYHTDITEHELAGVLDNYGSHFFQRKIKDHHKEYLNSGVLLLNLDLIRKTGLFKKARTLCQQEKMFMPDQTALNRLCGTKLILDRKYNEQAATKEDTIFRHFTTTFAALPYPHPQTIKPWHISAVHDKLKEHAYDDILSQYQTLIKGIKDE